MTLKHNDFNNFIAQWEAFLGKYFDDINWEEVRECEKFIWLNFTDQSQPAPDEDTPSLPSSPLQQKTSETFE